MFDFGNGWTVGASYQHSEQHGLRSDLGALHVLWRLERGEVLGEFLTQGGHASASRAWGTYLQGVYEIERPFYLVGRYEHYRQPSPLPSLDLWTLGAVYRPQPHMALKLEYRFVGGNPDPNPEGVFSSFSILF